MPVEHHERTKRDSLKVVSGKSSKTEHRVEVLSPLTGSRIIRILDSHESIACGSLLTESALLHLVCSRCCKAQHILNIPHRPEPARGESWKYHSFSGSGGDHMLTYSHQNTPDNDFSGLNEMRSSVLFGPQMHRKRQRHHAAQAMLLDETGPRIKADLPGGIPQRCHR